MKKYVFLLALTLALPLSAQDGEFKVHSNGLIYSPYAMNKLSHVVDSLNLKFRSCDFDKVYYAKAQTIGHFVELREGNIRQATKDLRNRISLNAFLKKYPKAKLRRNLVVVKFKYKDDEDKNVIDFSEIDLKGGYGRGVKFTKNLHLYNKDLKNEWVFKYFKKAQFSKERVSAFFFPKEFESKELNENYSRMIGYADCMIDTTTVKFREDAISGFVEMPKRWRNFSLNKKTNLLSKLRKTKVYGTCSMDSSPRVHALNIALLSAETVNWKVFLRAHLDILNDNFERASDGSYAWEGRKTYIKELEAMDINVSDLILGISLRVENPAQNHYYGSISRVGRAITESESKNEIARQILDMIEDNELDDYNRVLAYFLYLNYSHYQKNENEKKQSLERLKKSIKQMPEYIQSKIAFDE